MPSFCVKKLQESTNLNQLYFSLEGSKIKKKILSFYIILLDLNPKNACHPCLCCWVDAWGSSVMKFVFQNKRTVICSSCWVALCTPEWWNCFPGYCLGGAGSSKFAVWKSHCSHTELSSTFHCHMRGCSLWALRAEEEKTCCLSQQTVLP